MLTITDAARKTVLALLEGEEQKDLALRVAIRGRGPGGFRYELQFVDAEERGAEDTVVNAGGFDVFVDPDSAPNLKGATVDFLDGVTESGFKVDNPNPLWTDPKAQAVQDAIDTQINTGGASNGGDAALLDAQNN